MIEEWQIIMANEKFISITLKFKNPKRCEHVIS